MKKIQNPLREKGRLRGRPSLLAYLDPLLGLPKAVDIAVGKGVDGT
jgi:hypothetical protein